MPDFISVNRKEARRAGDEDRLAMALASAGMVGVWDSDLVASRVFGDANFARIFGVDAALTAAGCPMGTYVLFIHPDDVAAVNHAMQLHFQGAADFAAEYRIIRTDGAERWVFSRGRLARDATGLPNRFSGISLDVTDRKHAELRQGFLLQLADRLLALGDPAAIVRTAVTMLGEHLGASRVGYGQVSADGTAIELHNVYSKGVASLDGVLPLAAFGAGNVARQRQGRTMIYDDVASDPEGEAPVWAMIDTRAAVAVPLIRDGVYSASFFANHRLPHKWTNTEIGIMQDVAARIWDAMRRASAEAELRAANAMLEQRIQAALAERAVVEDALRQAQKMEAVGQLTGGLAHDFNNLLAGIIGNLELMQTRLEEGCISGLARYIDSARGAADRAAALTHRLLAFSRRQTLAPVPTQVNTLIAGMQDLICRTMGPGVQVDVRADDALWDTLVDRNQLENALLNLCINARDAMPAGGRLAIEAVNRHFDSIEARERDLAEGDYVRLRVSDTGTGMPPDVICRAFDPFFTTKPIGQGTGLGLSMVYGFARQSGGQALIESSAEGATVCIDLPRTWAAACSLAPPCIPTLPAAPPGETVLVVDDEPTLRSLVAEALGDWGFTALTAENSEQALGTLNASGSIDLLVTDVGLPGGMNGRQLADSARAARPGLKVIFITGYAEQAVLGGGDLPCGMAILTKPFTMDALNAAVGGMITAPGGRFGARRSWVGKQESTSF